MIVMRKNPYVSTQTVSATWQEYVFPTFVKTLILSNKTPATGDINVRTVDPGPASTEVGLTLGAAGGLQTRTLDNVAVKRVQFKGAVGASLYIEGWH